MIRLIIMAILEKILYPSNKFAVVAFVVVVSILAIFAIISTATWVGTLCVSLGIGIGWLGHIVTIRHHRIQDSIEFRPWEINLERAKHQLDSCKGL